MCENTFFLFCFNFTLILMSGPYFELLYFMLMARLIVSCITFTLCRCLSDPSTKHKYSKTGSNKNIQKFKKNC